MHYFYKITDTLNNKVYIGQTVNAEKRWVAHKAYAKNPENTGQYLHRAMAKYGIDNFTYEIIAQCLSQNDANETEIQLINQYDSRNKESGYNRAPGGNIAWQPGLPSHMYPMYGKHHSENTKQKISNSQIGKTNDEDAKIKMSKAAKARKPRIGTIKKNKHMTQEIAELIRKEYAVDVISFAQLASKYDRTIGTISNIINQKSWKQK